MNSLSQQFQESFACFSRSEAPGFQKVAWEPVLLELHARVFAGSQQGALRQALEGCRDVAGLAAEKMFSTTSRSGSSDNSAATSMDRASFATTH